MSNILKIINHKFCSNIKRIPFYHKTLTATTETTTTTTTENKTLTPFTENLYSFSHKNNLSYPEPLVQ
jgi:hypothetical protein